MVKLSVITVLVTFLLIVLLLTGVIDVNKYLFAWVLFTSLDAPISEIGKNLKEKIKELEKP